jgi:hypothetical protein
MEWRKTMKRWFGAPRPAHAHGGAATDAYVEETRRDPQAEREDAKAAYRRGRHDERKRRRGSPLLSFVVLIIAAAAVALIYLAAQNGSFSSGGAVVDRNLSTASKTAQAPFRGAAGKAGDALERAGQTLKRQAGQ